MIYCLIPARAGSKRLPDKNTKPLMGKPLICWTIDVSLESKYFEEIYISTNDIKVKNIVNRNYDNVCIIERPDEYSKDDTCMNDVIKHFIVYKDLCAEDIVTVLYPTNPFRSNVDKVVLFFIENDFKSLQVLKRAIEKPFCGLQRRRVESSERDIFSMVIPEMQNLYRTQDAPEIFFATGSMYMMRVDELPRLNRQLFNIETAGWILENDYEALDIDNAMDFKIAESIASDWINSI